ncbi:MAG: B12-binding domain-containing radical SAM protein [Chromatiales bacterium]|nr:B12-binding domain-containing radical SAM protein [Chromatiales bacterium]
MNRPDVWLVFPPLWAPFLPPTSLAMLAAYLRESGRSVVVDDQNLKVFNDLLDADRVREVAEEVRGHIASAENSTETPPTHYRKWVLADLFADRVLHNLPLDLEVIHKRAFKDAVHVSSCYATLAEALTVIEAAHPGYTLGLENFTAPVAVRNAAELMDLVNNPSGLPFLQTLTKAACDITERKPKVVGLSIISDTQLLSALVLARLIRERYPEVHITAGGAAITYLGEQLVEHSHLFDRLFDSFVVGNGELALEGLLKMLDGCCTPEDIPNLRWRDPSGVFRVSAKSDPLMLDDLPLPDYTGLEPSKYMAPRPGICMSAFAKGCYWGKCSFCFEHLWKESRYRPRPVARVADQMQQLSEQWGVTHFELIDLAVAPRNLGGLGEELSQRGLTFSWTALTRSEVKSDKVILQKAYDGGCVALLIGFESASERVLQLMRKGLSTDAVRRFFADAAEVGIWTHAYIIVGFPGETREEAVETLRFVNKAVSDGMIHSVGASPFVLCMHTPIYKAPESFGVQIHQSQPDDLDFEVEYSAQESLDRETIDSLLQTYDEFFQWPVSTLITAALLRDHSVSSLIKQISERSTQRFTDKPYVPELRQYRWNVFDMQSSMPLTLKGDPVQADWSPLC